jgi:prepilin-type N-terminal cleavage/methylation domain-containing protein
MNRRGVTLIELLIAVSLLSLLSIGILFAMRVGINAIAKADTKLMANRRAVAVQQILRKQIEGLMPVSGACPTGAAGMVSAAPILFFQGQTQSMRFVSTYSLEEAGRGYPRVLELQVMPRDPEPGVRLVVNESLYTGPMSTAAQCMGMQPDPASGLLLPVFRPIEIGPRSFVLADKLAYCRFSYREPPQPPDPPRWVAAWKLPQWPTGVHIDMAPLEPDPSQVPLMSVTAPVRVEWKGYGY